MIWICCCCERRTRGFGFEVGGELWVAQQEELELELEGDLGRWLWVVVGRKRRTTTRPSSSAREELKEEEVVGW